MKSSKYGNATRPFTKNKRVLELNPERFLNALAIQRTLVYRYTSRSELIGIEMDELQSDTGSRAATSSAPDLDRVEKLFDLVPPKGGLDNVQSICRFGSSWLVFHQKSTMQVYRNGDLIRKGPVDGALLHPNDCAVRGDEVVVCDAGDATPVIKGMHPESMQVHTVYPIKCPGWRLASIAVDKDASILVVAVEDLPLRERSRLLVRRYNEPGTKVMQEFTVPTANVYSQGCTVLGSSLYLNNNDGPSSTSARVMKVDLVSEQYVDEFLIKNLGETEGLERAPGGQDGLITAVRDAVYFVAAS